MYIICVDIKYQMLYCGMISPLFETSCRKLPHVCVVANQPTSQRAVFPECCLPARSKAERRSDGRTSCGRHSRHRHAGHWWCHHYITHWVSAVCVCSWCRRQRRRVPGCRSGPVLQRPDRAGPGRWWGLPGVLALQSQPAALLPSHRKDPRPSPLVSRSGSFDVKISVKILEGQKVWLSWLDVRKYEQKKDLWSKTMKRNFRD